MCFVLNPGLALLPVLVLTCGLTLAGSARAATPPVAPSPPPPQLSAAAALPLTVGQAINLALVNNPALQQAANQVASSAVTVARRRADFAPDLGLTLTGSERFDQALGVDGRRDGRNFETAGGNLASTVNLFNGFGDVAALHSAEWQLAGEQDRFTREAQTLLFSTVSAFLQALGDRELIGVRAENLEGNRRQLEQVEALHRAGNRPVSDLYQQQAETANAELELLVAERNYAVSKLQLLQTIGLPPLTAIEPQAPELGALEAALVARRHAPPQTGGLAWRADLSAGEKQLEAARVEVTQARAGYWPSLNLSASIGADYTSLDRDTGFTDQFFDDNLGGALGLTLSVPIFDRWQTRHQVAEARLRRDDARWSLLQRQLQAEAELGQALRDFATAQKLIGVTESRLTAARQALAAVEERYRVGAATLVELTQARAQFVAASFDRVKARYDLVTQGVAVAYYQGDEEQLRELLALWENPQ